MDRLLVRQDSQGKDIVFIANSLNQKKTNLLAWRPEDPSAEPFLVSREFYNTAKPVSENKEQTAAKAYRLAWGQEVQVMKRLPRVVGERPSFSSEEANYRRSSDKLSERNEEVGRKATAKTTEEKPKAQSYIMKMAGSFWRIQDQSGNSVAYTVDEEDALRVLQELAKTSQN